MKQQEERKIPGYVIQSGYDRELAKQSVGKGWHELIDEVFDRLDEDSQYRIKIVQVKEKYAGLRIYTDIYEEDFQRFLTDVEKRSFKICETCGKPGKIRGKGWYYTSCDEHAERGDAPHEYQPGDKHAEEN